MLEFIFFHQKPFKLFLAQLENRGLEFTTTLDEAEDEYEVHMDENIDDDLLEEIEDIYDQLMDMNQQLVDQEEGDSASNYHLASITVTLADGTISHASIPPTLLSKIMQVITPEELGEIVTAIADAVENPDDRSMCQRVRDGDVDFEPS
ncbi:MAG: hypothetical protein OQL06_09015 [Gammaproteobacteria bacterium]|nr:hypothetical protein [Gammaproteobacteria bacterium]